MDHFFYGSNQTSTTRTEFNYVLQCSDISDVKNSGTCSTMTMFTGNVGCYGYNVGLNQEAESKK